MVALAGMDPFAYLHEEDEFKRSLMEAIAVRFRDTSHKMDLNRATMIANAVGKALFRK